MQGGLGPQGGERILPAEVFEHSVSGADLPRFHSGPEAAARGLGPPPHLRHWDVQHHGRVRHRHLERGPSQDRVWL